MNYYEPDGCTRILEEGKKYHKNGKLHQKILIDEEGKKIILEYNKEGNLYQKNEGYRLFSFYS